MLQQTINEACNKAMGPWLQIFERIHRVYRICSNIYGRDTLTLC